MENLSILRKKLNLSQKEAAILFGVSLRSYQDYETIDSKKESIKYKYFVDSFKKKLFVDEEHGTISIDIIKSACEKVFKDYVVRSCYLFGSYAKGKQTPSSDVDLLIDTTADGMEFFVLVEKLRRELKKKVDLLDINQVINNKPLLQEILMDGIKIYG